PDYWVRQLRGTVQFSAGLEELLSQSGRILLEVGPGRTLSALVRQHPGAQAGRFFSSLHRTRQLLPQTLGQLWLAGVDVDWEGFYADQRRRRVPLPLYPFERQRYWIDAAWEPAPATRRREDLRDWFAVPDWQQSALPTTPTAGPGRWLLFGDECGLGDEIAHQLTDAGAAVVTVEPGTAFTRRVPGRYAVRPAERADYESLWTALEADGGIPEHWVHLWSVNPADTPAEVLQRSFYSLLSQVQALGPRTPAVEIGIVSTAMQTVAGGEPVYPEKAALLGPCRIIPQEYPHLRCRSIDVDLDAAGSLDAPARQLIAELRNESSDPVIAYRDGTRWVQRFIPAPLAPPGEQLPLRPQGVYLITGGLGGLGLVVARHLADACRARLVLTSRSEATSDQIRQLRELEELGAEVLVEQADVADEQAMRRVVAAATDRWGGLHGVIHAAGVAGGGVIQLKRRETATEVLRPRRSPSSPT
ncbi:MAG: SDR family NAD(P)-dependent oxidoreductase, partial [bacterium]|nr:SDR family NAD(P)-dependent oxidoreductase [bacterium]